MKHIAHLVVMTAALLASACGAEVGETQRQMQAYVGADTAGLVVQTLDGAPQPFADLLLAEDMGGAGGKPVVVNVWATWCPPCIKELPSLDMLGKSGKAKVIAIATDKDAQAVKDFLREQPYGSGMTVWFDASGIITRDVLGARAVPVSYVLDPASLKVVQVEAGDRDWMRVDLKTAP